MKSLSRIFAAFAFFCAVPSVAHAELPTLEQAMASARLHAIAVSEASSEVGVANAQLRGARLSSIGNPYTDLQIDKGFGSGISQELQVLTYSYIPVDIAGQRGKRLRGVPHAEDRPDHRQRQRAQPHLRVHHAQDDRRFQDPEPLHLVSHGQVHHVGPRSDAGMEQRLALAW